MAKRRKRVSPEKEKKQTEKALRKVSRKSDNQMEPALMKQSQQKLSSRDVMNLQRKFGNKAVQQMLVQRENEGDQGNPAIKESQLTLQTAPKELGEEIYNIMSNIHKMAEQMDMLDYEIRIMEEALMLKDLPEIILAYRQAIDFELIGSMLKNGPIPQAAMDKDPFKPLDEHVQTIAMSPGHLLAGMQQVALMMAKTLTTDVGIDGEMASQQEVRAAMEKLEDMHQPFFETVSDGMRAGIETAKAVDKIYKFKRQLKR